MLTAENKNIFNAYYSSQTLALFGGVTGRSGSLNISTTVAHNATMPDANVYVTKVSVSF